MENVDNPKNQIFMSTYQDNLRGTYQFNTRSFPFLIVLIFILIYIYHNCLWLSLSHLVG